MKPKYKCSRYQLFLGDSLKVLKDIPSNSVHSIVCDPPYELGFMGKGWDKSGIANNVELWKEALRVLKPGGHLLAFSGSRTYHRMVCAIEDAGFEVRDQIMWLYGSGFPKSLDVSKAIDKARDDSADGLMVGAWLKARRESRGLKQKDVASLWPSASGGLTGCVANWETLGKVPKWDQWLALKAFIGFSDDMDAEVWRLNGRKGTPGNEREILAERPASGIGQNGAAFGGHAEGATQKIDGGPATEAARQWSGFGTALKPAHEPICVARKPLIGTVAANVLAHKTGAINIDACRVPTAADDNIFAKNPHTQGGFGHAGATVYGDSAGASAYDPTAGRWPANILHDGSPEVVGAFAKYGQKGASAPVKGTEKSKASVGNITGKRERVAGSFHSDTGTAARFFYCAKASKSDRNEGCDGLARKHQADINKMQGNEVYRNRCSVCDANLPYEKLQHCGKATVRVKESGKPRENHHPTVKPTELMRYLVRLVTPPNGIVLDPFMGSGSTGKACMLEGFKFAGIDITPEYVEISRARIKDARKKYEAKAQNLFTGKSKTK